MTRQSQKQQTRQTLKHLTTFCPQCLPEPQHLTVWAIRNDMMQYKGVFMFILHCTEDFQQCTEKQKTYSMCLNH